MYPPSLPPSSRTTKTSPEGPGWESFTRFEYYTYCIYTEVYLLLLLYTEIFRPIYSMLQQYLPPFPPSFALGRLLHTPARPHPVCCLHSFPRCLRSLCRHHTISISSPWLPMLYLYLPLLFAIRPRCFLSVSFSLYFLPCAPHNPLGLPVCLSVSRVIHSVFRSNHHTPYYLSSIITTKKYCMILSTGVVLVFSRQLTARQKGRHRIGYGSSILRGVYRAPSLSRYM